MTLRKIFARKSLPLQIFVANDSVVNFNTSHHANMAFCAAWGMTPKSQAFLNGNQVGKKLASGCVVPGTFAPDNSKNDAVLHKAFRDLWGQLFKTEGSLTANSLSSFKTAIEQRRLMRDQIKAKKYNQYGFLVLRFDAHGDQGGGFPILREMEDILNAGFAHEEPVAIPAVVLRHNLSSSNTSQSNSGVSRMDILFAQKGYSLLHNDLADIRSIYQEGKQ